MFFVSPTVVDTKQMLILHNYHKNVHPRYIIRVDKTQSSLWMSEVVLHAVWKYMWSRVLSCILYFSLKQFEMDSNACNWSDRTYNQTKLRLHHGLDTAYKPRTEYSVFSLSYCSLIPANLFYYCDSIYRSKNIRREWIWFASCCHFHWILWQLQCVSQFIQQIQCEHSPRSIAIGRTNAVAACLRTNSNMAIHKYSNFLFGHSLHRRRIYWQLFAVSTRYGLIWCFAHAHAA